MTTKCIKVMPNYHQFTIHISGGKTKFWKGINKFIVNYKAHTIFTIREMSSFHPQEKYNTFPNHHYISFQGLYFNWNSHQWYTILENRLILSMSSYRINVPSKRMRTRAPGRKTDNANALLVPGRRTWMHAPSQKNLQCERFACSQDKILLGMKFRSEIYKR